MEAFPCSAPEGVAVRRVVLEGDPTDKPSSSSLPPRKCDLIVMPTHGYGPFRRFLLGSVTAKVLHDAICPVWTGPHMESAPDYSSVHFHNIVCAIDLGLHSREVLCWAAGFAREFGARPFHRARHSGLRHAPRRLLFRSRLAHPIDQTAIERIASFREEMEIEASVAIEAGEPPVVVATAAETLKADLLVIGRGSTPRAHGHLPTNAYAIVRAVSVSGGDGLKRLVRQMPEWRLKICSMFCDSAERAITMSQPASCA